MEIRSIGIMGSGIAQICATKGIDTFIAEKDKNILEKVFLNIVPPRRKL
mgnify:CR=1 FL=1